MAIILQRTDSLQLLFTSKERRVIKTSLQASRLCKMLKGEPSTSIHTSLLLGFKGTEKRCCKNTLIWPRTRTYRWFKKYHPSYCKRQQLLTHSWKPKENMWGQVCVCGGVCVKVTTTPSDSPHISQPCGLGYSLWGIHEWHLVCPGLSYFLSDLCLGDVISLSLSKRQLMFHCRKKVK